MGFTGDMFTWQRGKIHERLDRGVANAQWRNLFPNAVLVNEETLKSDHRPICVTTEVLDVQQGRANHSPRHFEARWLKEDTVQEVVQTAWARAIAQGRGTSFMCRVNRIHSDMHAWDKETLKKPVQRIKKLRRELENLK